MEDADWLALLGSVRTGPGGPSPGRIGRRPRSLFPWRIRDCFVARTPGAAGLGLASRQAGNSRDAVQSFPVAMSRLYPNPYPVDGKQKTIINPNA